MVEDGVVDIYLPNDIHWGYQGYKAAYLATKEKIEELKKIKAMKYSVIVISFENFSTTTDLLLKSLLSSEKQI